MKKYFDLRYGIHHLPSPLWGTQVNRGIRGEQFLSPNLSSDQKETMDRIVTEWIVDEDQCFNAASTTGFKAMMSTATNGNYDGCYHTTV
jgi:hypothetical protein